MVRPTITEANHPRLRDLFLMLLSLVAMGCHHDSAPTAFDFRAQAPVYDTEHLIRPTSCDLLLHSTSISTSLHPTN